MSISRTRRLLVLSPPVPLPILFPKLSPLLYTWAIPGTSPQKEIRLGTEKKSSAGGRPSRGKQPGRPEPVQQTPDPEVRMDKVAKIREAVLSGKYKVPASKVAAKILDDMRRK